MDRFFYVCCHRECVRRSIDASRMFNYLEASGWKPTRDVSQADLMIVYTCGGFNFSELRSVKTVKRAISNKRKKTKVIVTGCLLRINPQSLQDLKGIEIVADNDLNKLDSIINSVEPFDEFPDSNSFREVMDLDDYSLFYKFINRLIFNTNFVKFLPVLLYKGIKNRKSTSYVLPGESFKIKISQGCLGECTYCAIKLASGELKSKSEKNIIKEFQNGLDLGFTHFVFISHELGCYGLERGICLVDLLKEIFKENREFKLIVNDLNLKWLIKDKMLLPLFIENKEKIADIRIPIQSGSSKILDLMNRCYTKEDIREVIKQMNEKMPGVKIHTHLIVGFPGETRSDFLDTMSLIDDFKFHKVDVFCYQDRPGIKSACLPNKLSKKEKIKRALELSSKGNHISVNY